MATTVKKIKSKHRARNHHFKAKLPHGVTKQLEKIYSQSKKTSRKHPFQVTGGVLLTLGLVSGSYYLFRYMMNK